MSFAAIWNVGRRGVSLLLGVIVLLVFAIGVSLIGIRLAGSTTDWQHWLTEHTRYFFVWRLGLYGITGYGWWRMRKRLQQRTPSLDLHQRLIRSEIAAVAAIILMEANTLLSP